MGNERRTFDLILFGATSFVGQILTRRLVERYGTDGALRWAIAGRDAAKLARGGDGRRGGTTGGRRRRQCRSG